jgi:DNA gyrase subunit B
MESDRDVFTDIMIPLDYFSRTLKRQAIVNAGVTFRLHDEPSGTTEEFYYPEGILGFVRELTRKKASPALCFLRVVAKAATELTNRNTRSKPRCALLQ